MIVIPYLICVVIVGLFIYGMLFLKPSPTRKYNTQNKENNRENQERIPKCVMFCGKKPISQNKTKPRKRPPCFMAKIGKSDSTNKYSKWLRKMCIKSRYIHVSNNRLKKHSCQIINQMQIVPLEERIDKYLKRGYN